MFLYTYISFEKKTIWIVYIYCSVQSTLDNIDYELHVLRVIDSRHVSFLIVVVVVVALPVVLDTDTSKSLTYDL